MESIQSAGKFSRSEVRRLNYCRLNLKAVTVSDLTDISGHHLDPQKLHGHTSLLSSQTSGLDIHQEQPSESEWTLWRRANKLWSVQDGSLKQPLGDWVLDIHDKRQHHFSYWSPGKLWILSHGTYLESQLVKEPHVYRETSLVCDWQSLPVKAMPVLALQSHAAHWTVIQTSTVFDHKPLPPTATFAQYVEALAPREIELLTYVELEADPYTVCEALSHGIRAVSDGSDWHQTQGSFGWWVMSNDLGKRCAYGMGPARSASPNAYRSESYGLLSLLCFLRQIAEFTGHSEPWRGTLATDSLSLIDTVLDSGTNDETHVPNMLTAPTRQVQTLPLDPLSPDWDVVRGIQVMLIDMPNLVLQRVKGHQDKHTLYHRFPLLAQLNVDADKQASRFQREHGGFQPDVLHTAWSGVHLVLPTGTFTSHLERTALRLQATAPPLQAFMAHQYEWTTTRTMESINWKAHGTSLRHQVFAPFSEVGSWYSPTNAKLHRKDLVHSLCPLCNQAPEKWQHILRCSHSTRQKWQIGTLKAV